MNRSPARPTSTSGRVEGDTQKSQANCTVKRFSKKTKRAFSTRSKFDIAKQIDKNLSSERKQDDDKDLVLDKEDYEMLNVSVPLEIKVTKC